MRKIKLTKNELKRQKEALQRFNRYLPTLLLKKQSLQYEINKINTSLQDILHTIENLRQETSAWVDVFAENLPLNQLLKIKKIKTRPGNVAGIDIPLFVEVAFQEIPYDFMKFPLWVDTAIEVCKKMITLKSQALILRRQQEILKEELRITTQRVNLFEKIKIPETKENIRVIRIYLDDVQTAEVVRGKIAKNKLGKNDYLS